ncbi:glycosyltransferase family 4 protein [Abyssalbus ytuae]|uniref:Glycosyltransferase family 4 protein n=1 Tax=Abyssalbus ytuae TaxID=2926907 RepID=A0A9E7CSC9_9FLAO|nr:glycosyltransferase family 4 protein [Abyssalbus ytuae]UOB16076.1 glycosyltransferase family 4 protein [Abyssalbus ytuae]
MLKVNTSKVLIVGAQWPEPNASAAGMRMLQIIKALSDFNYRIFFGCVADLPEENVLPDNVERIKIELNNSSFDRLLERICPQTVIFDRYFTEEQFGWRVAKVCPEALRVLDTEDLHFLRFAREEAVRLNIQPQLINQITVREMASMYRCDISLIISLAEIDILKETFNFPDHLILYLPFMADDIKEDYINSLPSFNNRVGFIFIGNYKHKPNVDAVNHLVKNLFPEIRSRLDKAGLNIYGAYAGQNIQKLHNPEKGIYVKGWVKDATKVMQTARLCLAPLRYGAGQKGKLLEAMQNGTPCITTPVGAEGMSFGNSRPGRIAKTDHEFIEDTVKLYLDEKEWKNIQKSGFDLINKQFSYKEFSKIFIETLINIRKKITQHRDKNFIGQMLQYHRVQSTRYLSKYIEEKNKKTGCSN